MTMTTPAFRRPPVATRAEVARPIAEVPIVRQMLRWRHVGSNKGPGFKLKTKLLSGSTAREATAHPVRLASPAGEQHRRGLDFLKFGGERVSIGPRYAGQL